MKWYEFRTDSIAALAELLLSCVIMFYLFTIRRKSKDGQIITRYICITTIYYFLFFIKNINETQWGAFITIAVEVVALALAIYHVWFSYVYRQSPYRKEMRAVISVFTTTAFTAVGLQDLSHFFGYKFFTDTHILFPLLTIFYSWSIVVFIRKQIFFKNAITDETRLSAIRSGRAYGAFALWSGLFVIIYLGWILAFNHRIGFLNALVINHVFNLISLTWFAINFVNYAEEYTTFQAKLVGLILCAVLLLLGSIGFLILPGGYIENTIANKPIRNAINTLMFLVPVMTILIVLVFPIFFQRNLLRPLQLILNGVQKVNAGDLNVEIAVDVRDEIGFLSQNFNQMSHSLRLYAEDMENKVSQRTIELKHKSDELELQKEELQTTLKDLKAAQSQLIQSEKMASLGELTAGIAHEIQNPLNFVNNFSDVNTELIEDLKAELATGNGQEAIAIADDIKENNQKINHHGKRADAIVKGMLQHSRSSTGKKELTDINALVDESLRLSYHGLRAKDKDFNADFRADFDQSIGNIEVVPQDIGRVLLNLFNNAFYSVSQKKAQLNGTFAPAVEVSTRRVDGTVEISVKDNGQGIPQKVVDKIFQPFFTTKPTGQGTGLGLSLSYDIVKAHGGKIKVESKEAEGSEFIIQLPIA